MLLLKKKKKKKHGVTEPTQASLCDVSSSLQQALVWHLNCLYRTALAHHEFGPG